MSNEMEYAVGFSRMRRRMLRGSAAAGALGFGGGLLPATALAQQASLGVVSFPGPSISAHSKVIIKRNGLDKKHGWNLRWEIRPTTDAFYNDFVTGVYESIDFGGLNVFANLFNRGVPLKIVQATVHYPMPLIVRSDSGIKSVGDLKGKRVAAGRASFAFAYLGASLKAAGLDLEKDTQFSSVDFFQALPRLQRGDFDAAILLFEHAIKLLQDAPKDFAMLIDTTSTFAKAIGIQRCYQYQAVRTDWLARNASTVHNVIATYRDCSDFFTNRSQEAVKQLAAPLAEGGANLAEPIGTAEYITGALGGAKTLHVARPVADMKKDLMTELEAYRAAGLIEKVPGEAMFL